MCHSCEFSMSRKPVGGETQARIAEIMDIKIKKSLPMIALGVLIAGLIVGTIAFGLFG